LDGYAFEEHFWLKFNDFSTERFQQPSTIRLDRRKGFLPKQLTEKQFKAKSCKLNLSNIFYKMLK
jgi:hypothetical protein